LRNLLKGIFLVALFLILSLGAKSETPTPKEHFTHATWYAGKCIGRITAGGKRYNKNAAFVATYAHYPFGTKLKITNLRNHRSIVVPVEDREPYHPGRAVDLSYAAAKELDILSAGVVPILYSQVIPNRHQGDFSQ
jgi:rare lipoprotein A